MPQPIPSSHPLPAPPPLPPSLPSAPQVFDPSALPPEDYLDALQKEWTAEEERRKAARAAGQGRVEFLKSGGCSVGESRPGGRGGGGTWLRVCGPHMCGGGRGRVVVEVGAPDSWGGSGRLARQLGRWLARGRQLPHSCAAVCACCAASQPSLVGTTLKPGLNQPGVLQPAPAYPPPSLAVAAAAAQAKAAAVAAAAQQQHAQAGLSAAAAVAAAQAKAAQLAAQITANMQRR